VCLKENLIKAEIGKKKTYKPGTKQKIKRGTKG